MQLSLAISLGNVVENHWVQLYLGDKTCVPILKLRSDLIFITTMLNETICH